MQTLVKANTWEGISQIVEARRDLAVDFNTSYEALNATLGDDGGLLLRDEKNGVEFGFNDLGLAQLSRRIGLPGPYTAEMIERKQGELIVPHVNYWLGQQPQEKDLLVRTLKNDKGGFDARAFLSDKYGILDDHEVLAAAQAALEEAGLLDELAIQDVWQTDRSFHVRFSDKSKAINAAKLDGHRSFIPKGHEDYLFPMIHLSNSEVGLGSIKIAGGTYRVVCANGLVAPAGPEETQLSKRHFGDGGDLAKYVVEQAENIVRGAEKFTSSFAESQAVQIENVDEYLRNILARNRVTKREEKAIFEELGESPTNTASAYDVVNAITATARGLAPDARVGLERIAATVLSLN
jgi:hypothetical protein